MKSITSAANANFRRWLRLATQPRAVREEKQTLAEGLHLAQAALAPDVADAAVSAAVSAVIVRAGARGGADRTIAPLLERALQCGAAGFELAAALYDRIAPVEQGSGLLLVLDIAPAVLPSSLAADVLFLDRIQDPGNAGALLRTAAAAGVAMVVAAPGTASLWAPKVLRAAQGAHFRLHLQEDIAAAQLRAVFSGTVIGMLAHGATPLWSAPLPSGAVAWIAGAEGSGLSGDALAVCDGRVTIPVAAAVESLNVAAATAICLFERQRRRLQSVAVA